MSFQALNIRLQDMAKSLDNLMPDIIAQQVMIELMADHKDRIFGKGINSDGQPIGEYSKKPGYFSKDQFIRQAAFKPLGKPNKDRQRRTNTTMFIQGGYSEFRDIQGRQTEHINLKFSGSLERNINVGKTGNAVMYGTTDADESEKFDGLESRFNAFELTESEKQFVKDEITNQAIIVAKKSGQ